MSLGHISVSNKRSEDPCDVLVSWDYCANHAIVLNTLRPRQNGRHFADDVFKCIFLNGNVWILLKISLKYVPKGPNNNIPSSVQVMAWRRPGEKPLSEPNMVSLLTHMCVARPQWVKTRPGQRVSHNAIYYAYCCWKCFYIYVCSSNRNNDLKTPAK